jgi:PEGA domain
MRRTRALSILVLTLATLLSLGVSEATAGGRTTIRGGRNVHQGVIVLHGGYVSPYYWDPFWDPGFGWGVSYAYGPYGPPRAYGYVPPRNAAPVELHVKPRKATVVVDGTDVGQARDFDSRAYPLWLKAGTHHLELRYKDHQTLRVRIEVRRGKAYRVNYELRDGEGIDSRSSSTLQEPESDED